MIDGIAFERLPATSGVPQAVLLAHTSLWYLSMTLLVPSSRWQTSTALNADDTKLCRTILTMEDWYLESSLNQIRSCSNTSECKVLTVTRKKTPVTHDYLLGDVNLQRIQEAIYGSWRYYFLQSILGLAHYAHCPKANRILSLLNRIYPLITNIKVRRKLSISRKVTPLLCDIGIVSY